MCTARYSVIFFNYREIQCSFSLSYSDCFGQPQLACYFSSWGLFFFYSSTFFFQNLIGAIRSSMLCINGVAVIGLRGYEWKRMNLKLMSLKEGGGVRISVCEPVVHC